MSGRYRAHEGIGDDDQVGVKQIAHMDFFPGWFISPTGHEGDDFMLHDAGQHMVGFGQDDRVIGYQENIGRIGFRNGVVRIENQGFICPFGFCIIA